MMTSMTPAATTAARYVVPGWFTRRMFNPTIALLTRLGVSFAGSRVLAVRGRRSAEWRHTVVNVLTVDGTRYLVAPRGTTQWVRNLRASGAGTLRVGRRVEEVTATEMPDDEKTPVLRAYLDKWGWEVGQFFEGLDKHATDEQLTTIAPGFPVFRLV
jgi:deazaflavin-dependent oxidoreductase (nitroreductase family)